MDALKTAILLLALCSPAYGQTVGLPTLARNGEIVILQPGTVKSGGFVHAPLKNGGTLFVIPEGRLGIVTGGPLADPKNSILFVPSPRSPTPRPRPPLLRYSGPLPPRESPTFRGGSLLPDPIPPLPLVIENPFFRPAPEPLYLHFGPKGMTLSNRPAQ